jgi:hypothetical protein
MARLVGPGRHVVACLPCGNAGSFEERIVRSVKGGIETSRTGEARFFYEDEAHLRRVTTARLEELFGREGCVVADLFFTGHMWGAIQYFAAQPSATGILVDHRRARGRRAALTMLALQAGFAFLRPTVRIHRTELRPRIARARGTRRLAAPCSCRGRGAKARRRRRQPGSRSPHGAGVAYQEARAERLGTVPRLREDRKEWRWRSRKSTHTSRLAASKE